MNFFRYLQGWWSASSHFSIPSSSNHRSLQSASFFSFLPSSHNYSMTLNLFSVCISKSPLHLSSIFLFPLFCSFYSSVFSNVLSSFVPLFLFVSTHLFSIGRNSNFTHFFLENSYRLLLDLCIPLLSLASPSTKVTQILHFFHTFFSLFLERVSRSNYADCSSVELDFLHSFPGDSSLPLISFSYFRALFPYSFIWDFPVVSFSPHSIALSTSSRTYKFHLFIVSLLGLLQSMELFHFHLKRFVKVLVQILSVSTVWFKLFSSLLMR